MNLKALYHVTSLFTFPPFSYFSRTHEPNKTLPCLSPLIIVSMIFLGRRIIHMFMDPRSSNRGVTSSLTLGDRSHLIDLAIFHKRGRNNVLFKSFLSRWTEKFVRSFCFSLTLMLFQINVR
ncbi:hypothetical protein BDB00DRAFT_444323 [Zychaea mexicana]|uniref:uncharacterized protein n=1 Tax=Zychaea mexicana TaxID=64656 RepID=UPI0022FEB38B|nr:uncharacterized protein BDB00DRAFT_444323 [Zychaea mexicana]KAI9498348.1 hypothetical protein BDB00DRAFT_444323 [Zychaea mexicana]